MFQKLTKYIFLVTQTIGENKDGLGEHISENSLDALVHFNDDMKILGLNAF